MVKKLLVDTSVRPVTLPLLLYLKPVIWFQMHRLGCLVNLSMITSCTTILDATLLITSALWLSNNALTWMIALVMVLVTPKANASVKKAILVLIVPYKYLIYLSHILKLTNLRALVGTTILCLQVLSQIILQSNFPANQPRISILWMVWTKFQILSILMFF